MQRVFGQKISLKEIICTEFSSENVCIRYGTAASTQVGLWFDGPDHLALAGRAL